MLLHASLFLSGYTSTLKALLSYETDRIHAPSAVGVHAVHNLARRAGAMARTVAGILLRQCAVADARLGPSSTLEYCAPCHPCPETSMIETRNFRAINKLDKQRVLPDVHVDRAALTPYFGRCERGRKSRPLKICINRKEDALETGQQIPAQLLFPPLSAGTAILIDSENVR